MRALRTRAHTRSLQRSLALLVAAAMAISTMLFVVPSVLSFTAPPALADATDGTITVKVVQEVNADGLVDTSILEPPMADVTVRFTDAAGNVETRVTNALGLVVLDAASTSLTGGNYRVDVDNPDPTVYEPGFAANGQSPAAAPIVAADLADPTNVKLSTSTEFVTVADGANAYVNTSFWFPGFYCQANAPLVGACQSSEIAPAPTPAGSRTLLTVPYQVAHNSPITPLATNTETGTVYGIAWDKLTKRIFSGASAHRGSAYGPGGAGAIYVTSQTGGDTTLFATVPDAGSTAHTLTVNADYDFFDIVGKEALGEVEITNDGQHVFALNLNDQQVYVYDATQATASAPLGAYAIPNPCAAPEDWRPYGLGVGMRTEYVGGVCSAQSTQDPSDLRAYVFEFDAATGQFGSTVVDQPLDYGRGRGYKGTTCQGADDGNGAVGRWWPWIADYPDGPNAQRAAGCGGGWISYPQPIVADIIEDTNGDLIIGFRDRFGDQTDYQTINQRANGTFGPIGEVGAGGEVVRGCKLAAGGFVLDPNLTDPALLAPGSVCTDNNVAGAPNNGGQPTTYREYYTGDWRTGYHEEALYSGQALSRVEDTLVSSALDATGAVWTQGIAAINRDGTVVGGTSNGVRLDTNTSTFAKASGLADLEVLCDEAPLQVGNRIWVDTDKDGIQDPGELPLAGVTVNLYDGAGALVGTTVTNPDGTYLFDDSNVIGGLLQDTEYTIRLDKPEDSEPGGPLDGYLPTQAFAGDDPSLDSDGEVPPGGTYVETTITTGGAGENNHSYDFGFIESSPSVDIEKYDTVGGAVDGDADTPGTAIGYTPGETRNIQFDVTNDGTVDLVDVTVSDRTITGGSVQTLTCNFPDAPTTGTLVDGVWTVVWAATHAEPATAVWAVDETFTCTATLTLDGSAPPHGDAATVEAASAETGEVVTDRDDYYAFTGDVQLVKYDGRDGFVPDTGVDGYPEKPLIEGALRDANTAGDAVNYPVATGATTGPHPVNWSVTNTGATWLADVVIADTTTDGPDLDNVTCDFSSLGGPATGTTWAGPWEPGTTFTCTGDLTLDAEGPDATHGDLARVDATVIVPETNPDYDPEVPGSEPFTDQPAVDANDNPIRSDIDVDDDDPYHAETLVAAVELQKGDGDAATGVIENDADTMADGQVYDAAGETRDIVFQVANTGVAPLYNVVITDEVTAGDTAIQALACTFPGGPGSTAGVLVGTTWTVTWQQSFDVSGGVAWQPEETFSCTATLTLSAGDDPHRDLATVTTNLTPSGDPTDPQNPPPATPDGPSDDDPYNALSGEIQVIKYDGERPDPAIGAPGAWVPPTKPLVDGFQDANDWSHAVTYPVGEAQDVSWVVTNTGTTWLSNITLSDVTGTGPDVGAWVCDLSDVGGSSSYSFTVSGPWAGPFAPGASFICTGPLTLDANVQHADTVTVVGTVVVPALDDEGAPIVDDDGVPVYETDDEGDPVPAKNPDGSDFTVTDDDPFHAQTIELTVIKGDGDGAGAVPVIDNDANTMDEGAVYDPAGETRELVTTVVNESLAPLHDVVVTDVTTAGDAPLAMTCSFPDGTSGTSVYDAGSKTWTVRWDDTFAPSVQTWDPQERITCTATLTLDGRSDPHRNLASILAVDPSGAEVTDDDPYNALSGEIQVIKYDGERADPAIGAPGAWVPPTKPLVDGFQDANDWSHAVTYPVGEAQDVSWVVTNTGATWLSNITLTDVTGTGPDVGAWVCDLSDVGGSSSYSFTVSGPWAGPFAPGASFICTGPLTLDVNVQHADTVTVVGTVVVPALDDEGAPIFDEDGVPGYEADDEGDPVPAKNPDGSDFTVTDDDPFHAQTIELTVIKGDGDGAGAVPVIDNDANTMDSGAVYDPAGETRELVTTVVNESLAPLHDVVVTDVTTAGDAPLVMTCSFPDGTSGTSVYDEASKTWTVRWDDTFAPGVQTWDPAERITCTSELTLDGRSDPHRNLASILAVDPSGAEVTADDPYNAFSGEIQVIKYDGELPDPAIGVPGAWTPPTKPLVDAAQDANTEVDAVHYPSDEAQKVSWVVTNTGKTWLTDVVINDFTSVGDAIDAASISCTFPDGSTAGVSNGSITWVNPTGVLFEPGASFFCRGMLTMAPNALHADTVTASAVIVPPAVDEEGNPTDEPSLNEDGTPKRALDPETGEPYQVIDDDPFHAVTNPLPVPPAPVTPGPAVIAATGNLPRTGGDPWGTVRFAMILVLAGAGAVLLGQRRRNRSRVTVGE